MLQFSIHLTVNWYNTMFTLKEKLLTQNTVQKELGVNHSNNKERFSAGNLDDLL